MSDENLGDVSQVETPSTEEIINEPSQNPVQIELEREEKRKVRSEPEKATHALRSIADRAKELGLDPAAILGLKTKEPEGTLVTLEMLEAREKEKASKTALQLADEITDEHDRRLAKKYLLERIVPSGDAHEDLRFALRQVNAVKSNMIIEELGRKGVAATHSSAPGAPGKVTPPEPELTPEEKMILAVKGSDGQPILTKEEILAKRPK